MPHSPRDEASSTHSKLQLSSTTQAFKHIVGDAVVRIQKVVCHTAASTVTAILLLPTVANVRAEQQTFFHAHPSNDSTTHEDVVSIIDFFDFRGWQGQARSIRSGINRAECFGNLSLALSSIGPIGAYEASGASGALSLLPTAGALIGTPAKELWSLYKLQPAAGVLSMFLSLGGNIVPQSSSDYEIKSSSFQYGGFIATSTNEELIQDDDDMYDPNGSEVQQFAARVERRGRELRGSRKGFAIAFGMLLQCFWLAVLMAACWFTEQGGIVVWWCKAWGWMHAWYKICIPDNHTLGTHVCQVSYGRYVLSSRKHCWISVHHPIHYPSLSRAKGPHSCRCPFSVSGSARGE